MVDENGRVGVTMVDKYLIVALVDTAVWVVMDELYLWMRLLEEE